MPVDCACLSDCAKMAKSDREDVLHIQNLKDPETYSIWYFQIQILFKARDLIGIVDGTEKLEDATTAATQKDWNSRDAKAQHYIVSTLDKSVIPHIITCTTSKQMFDSLKIIYERDNNQQKCTLLTEFYNFKFKSKQSVIDNISALKDITYKLNRLNQNIDDTMLMTKILSVLPESYKHFSSAWDSTSEKDRTLNNLVGRLVQEEAKLKLSDEDTEGATFHAAVKFKSNFSNNVTCYECNKRGHLKRNCPNLQTNCTLTEACRRNDNHLAINCFFRRENQGKRNNNTGKSNSHNNDNDDNKAAFFAETEIFLTENETKSEFSDNCDKVNFILDSGSTNHLINDKRLFSTSDPCKFDIKTAKKSATISTSDVGSIVSKAFNLNNVYHVPDLSRNLLSVSAITKNKGKVVFDKNKVQILVDNRVIIEGHKTNNGLYTVDLIPEREVLVAQSHHDSVYNEWHRKMGHLNEAYLRKLTDLADGIPHNILKADDSVCSVCAEAKQT